MTSFWRLGLLGGPLVGSSPSPAMHEAALAAAGVEGGRRPETMAPEIFFSLALRLEESRSAGRGQEIGQGGSQEAGQEAGSPRSEGEG